MTIYGIGTDIVSIKRIKSSLKKKNFIRHIYSKKEVLKCKETVNPHNCYAKRFAAKEAIGKALGLGIRYPVNFKSIEISNDFYGKPYPVFNDELKKFCDNNKYKLHLSISDQKKYAQAFAIIEILEN